ncbi:hypothetical protein ACFPVT_01795 [Corynebacterium choanae]|nr:hypothetical protein [Corynebacterium choanae]
MEKYDEQSDQVATSLMLAVLHLYLLDNSAAALATGYAGSTSPLSATAT